MKKTTTIALSKAVHINLLQFIHILEKRQGKRISYSDAIEYLLTKIKNGE